MRSKVPRGYPSREITDNSARMLVAGFQQCPDLWSFRISMILNIEICIKELTLHLLPETVSSTAKSHLVLKLLGLLRDYIPELHSFIQEVSKDKARWKSVGAFSYTQERYSQYVVDSLPLLPLPEDLVTIYWILSDALRYYGLD